MPKSLKTDDLIQSIKRRAMIPSSQNTFQTADFLEILNEEFHMNLVPMVLNQHEDYYMVQEDVEIVLGQNRYPIPYRAIGNRIKDAHIRTDSGTLYEMTRIDSGNMSDYQGMFRNMGGYNASFYTEGDTLVLINNANTLAGHSIVFTYYIQPNILVENKYGTTIASIVANPSEPTTKTDITFANLPEGFQDSGAQFDIVGHKSPHVIYAYDLVPTAISGSTYTFLNTDLDGRLDQTTYTGSLPSRLEVGNYVTLAGETIIPQIPSELHPILTQLSAIYCLESMGDDQNLDRARQKLMVMSKNLETLLDDRVENAPKKVVNRNGALASVLGKRRWR